MINELNELILELASSLNESNKEKTAMFFLNFKSNISNAKNNKELKDLLKQLTTSSSIIQYADFSYKQEIIFRKIHEIASDYLEKL